MSKWYRRERDDLLFLSAMNSFLSQVLGKMTHVEFAENFGRFSIRRAVNKGHVPSESTLWLSSSAIGILTY